MIKNANSAAMAETSRNTSNQQSSCLGKVEAINQEGKADIETNPNRLK